VIPLQNEPCLFSNKTRNPPEIKSRNWKNDGIELKSEQVLKKLADDKEGTSDVGT
jgi:hypothetical protein